MAAGCQREARHQNVYGGAQPAGADKDDEADGCNSNTHIFLTKAMGKAHQQA